MKRVCLAQCLCPKRHAILATAAECAEEGVAEAAALREYLAGVLDGLLRAHSINPWCDLCGAPLAQWSVEVEATPYRTMAEARPALERLEEEQKQVRALVGALERHEAN